jgi:caa(3)-type oxidase subunit IV
MTASPSTIGSYPNHSRRNGSVFIALAILTAVEIALSSLGLLSFRSLLFLGLSLTKALLVALFFMHLKDDSRIYGFIILAPVVLVTVMAALVVVS